MTTVRDRVRAETIEEIKRLARRQLAEHGASELSLRAIARELGMVSSAVYRYVPSRDALLTLLIVDAYDALGEAVEQAEGQVARDDHTGRWRAACQGLFDWAAASPAEYGLLYGTPVPGYRAPEDTIGPASRVAQVMVRIQIDAHRAGALSLPASTPPLADVVERDVAQLAAGFDADLPPAVMAAGLMAWIQVFGAVSFERFGHLHNVVHDHEAWFAAVVERAGAAAGLR